MRFGPIPLSEAEGAILAHAVQVADRRFVKAHRLTAEDIDLLAQGGITSVIAAVPGIDDIDENAAAKRLSEAIAKLGFAARPPATGRVNLHADRAGLFTVDKGVIDAVNGLDSALTIATLPDKVAVAEGQMVATIKIIPFAVAEALVHRAATLLSDAEPMRIHAFRSRRIALIQTVLSGTKQGVLDKTARVTAARLERSHSTIVSEARPDHSAAAVASALSVRLTKADMAVVFGASAMSDFDDVIPAAIREAGGEVLRAGMPVDPGNLLVLGRIGGKPVIGAPGCARSPKENGFDWVLDRVIADVEVTASDIGAMGVGGLLMEIPTRPQPREMPVAAASDAGVEIVILAAGRSTRMGGPNKLMARFDGVPLVRKVSQKAHAAQAGKVVVVVGHQQERIREALAGLDVEIVENHDFPSGLASSLRVGVAAMSARAAGVMVVLADMPGLTTADYNRLISAFVDCGGSEIIRASHAGKRGNPVILPRALFGEVARLAGDTGARQIVESSGIGTIDIEIGEGAWLDVDTAETMAKAGGVLGD